MTKQAAKAEVNAFVGGLITEASPLNFPPTAAADIVNFELNRDGTVDRRLGFGKEVDGVFVASGISLSDATLSKPFCYEWISVNGDPDVNFVVVRLGNKLHFHKRDVSAISANLVGTVTLDLVNFPLASNISFAAVDGRLVLAGGSENFGVITYNSATNTFSSTTKRILVRDLWGVEVTGSISQVETDPTFRPATINDAHYYNLQNQSWADARRTEDTKLYQDPIAWYGAPYQVSEGSFFPPVPGTTIAVHPSNSETVWMGMQFTAASGGNEPFERLYRGLYIDITNSGVVAAKGRYIIDLLRRGQSRIDASAAVSAQNNGVTRPNIVLPSDITTKGASVVAEFAGRVFFAGFEGEVQGGDARSPNLSNYVLFSQLVKSAADISKCYQEGDPTSREANDLVDTDGGFIRISGAEGIVAMSPIGASLIVFARNGIWSIDGGSDYGFSATNYKVSKISSFGCISQTAIVESSERLFYWGNTGIYVIGRSQVGDVSVESLTDTTIQTFYKEIDGLSKEGCYGINDEINKKIRWIYNEGTRFSSTSNNIELVFDLVLGAFYKHSIDMGESGSFDYEMLVPIRTEHYMVSPGNEDVYSGVDQVFAGVDNVIIPEAGRQNGVQGVRYLILRSTSGSTLHHSFGLYNGSSFKDWHTETGASVDAKAFLITGSQTAGDSAIHKQIPYLTIHFRRTEAGVDINLSPLNPSGCLVRTRWDWSDNIVSGKWNSLQQAYKYRRPYLATGPSDLFDTGYEVVTTRLKQRGRGRSFALYLETEADKDCRIIGWNFALNANTIT